MEMPRYRKKSRPCTYRSLLFATILIGLAWLVCSSWSLVPTILARQTGILHSPVSFKNFSQELTFSSALGGQPPNLEEDIPKDESSGPWQSQGAELDGLSQDLELTFSSVLGGQPPNLEEDIPKDESSGPWQSQGAELDGLSQDLELHGPAVDLRRDSALNTSIPPTGHKLSIGWRDRYFGFADATVPNLGNKGTALHDDPYHDQKIFKEDFNKMLLTFKIFVYPHRHNDPFSNIFMPMDGEPSGNYASESYFKKALMNSDFITKNASEANMFYLPFSISRLRHDKRVGIFRLRSFISSYMATIRQKWPYWNQTAGADHFFVSCHSITKIVSKKVVYLRTNAIQVVCSSNSFLQGYAPHKDVSVPQVWPRKGTPLNAKLVKQRKVLAFFAGAANSPVRAAVVKAWSHDRDILVYSKHLSTPYSKALLTSKFCLHVKGFEVNTARIADAMHFGCVPVVLANHYDLPFANILDWDQFSLVVETSDIPLLKNILEGVSQSQYEKLQRNVMKVRKHFQWNTPPCKYDAFYMVMYELWSRRHVLKPFF